MCMLSLTENQTVQTDTDGELSVISDRRINSTNQHVGIPVVHLSMAEHALPMGALKLMLISHCMIIIVRSMLSGT